MVLEISERAGRKVTIVDVDRPLGYEELVTRYIGPNDVLPLLVRADGSRLMGIESFVPGKLRRFISGR